MSFGLGSLFGTDESFEQAESNPATPNTYKQKLRNMLAISLFHNLTIE